MGSGTTMTVATCPNHILGSSLPFPIATNDPRVTTHMIFDFCKEHIDPYNEGLGFSIYANSYLPSTDFIPNYRGLPLISNVVPSKFEVLPLPLL